MHVFSASKFEGEPKESEEMASEWFLRDSIPFEKMWPDDKFWFPFLLAEKNFQGHFLFRRHDEILSHRVVETVTFDDFKKLDLRVAKIILAERVRGSEKLLRLELDLGNGEIRQIVAGIGKAHTPEELMGREIVIVANLEPRILMGLESQGMLMAADSVEGPVILVPAHEVLPGTQIR
ncbi:MAG: methionine--tRNA ligase subunit beta [Candidatus Sungbacteria bacterium]|nr:methionine--tRNA ligase subunit beta [Candidatus Sungbacteria bacterium]